MERLEISCSAARVIAEVDLPLAALPLRLRRMMLGEEQAEHLDLPLLCSTATLPDNGKLRDGTRSHPLGEVSQRLSRRQAEMLRGISALHDQSHDLRKPLYNRITTHVTEVHVFRF